MQPACSRQELTYRWATSATKSVANTSDHGLTAIAVSKATMRPSAGFAPEGMQLNLENDHWWRGMVTQVYAYDWSEIKIEEQ